ncbi:MAG: thioesterase family protein [Actinomycetota bacterium]|nr:thioesterase family protein [Actinomycetota bacterium]
MARAFVGIVSNAEDGRQRLASVLESLPRLGTITCGSPIYEAEQTGVAGHGRLESAVVGLDTGLSPDMLLKALREIEREYGRFESDREGALAFDLDLLWYDGQAMDGAGFRVSPTPIRDRKSVLAPLVYASPGLADATGPYAISLGAVADQVVRKVSGQVDPTAPRWRSGLADALDLDGGDGSYSFNLDRDWQNRTEAMFGGFLGAAVLAAGGAEHPEMVPTSLTYRYLKPILAGGRASIGVEHNRRSDRSADLSMSVSVDGVECGRAHLSTVVDRGVVIASAKAPTVIPLHECVPVDEMIDASGGEPGNSVRSWRPLERWDIPDLVDGVSGKLRAWCPNPVEGSDDAYLAAAALFMPIDALIWPVTMLAAGRLGGKPIFTPTIEISARFAQTSNLGGWFLGEASIDHLTTKSVAGSIQVWAEDGTHAATGRSLNLTIG